MNALYHAHSGLRYLVLLLGLVALAVLAWGLATRRTTGAERGLTAAYTGALDLQLLLGLGVIVLGGIWYPALIGHLTMMILAAAVAHIASVRARRTAEPRRATRLRLIGVAISLVLLVGGIMSIGRGLLESRAPTAMTK